MKPKPAIVVKPRVKTGRPDLDALHTRQLLDRLGSERAKITHYGFMFPLTTEGDETGLESIRAEIDAIKAVLATREHIPTKAEAKTIRQDRAKHGR